MASQSVFFYLSQSLCISSGGDFSLCPSFCPFFYLCLLSVCLYTLLSTCLSVQPSVCQLLCLSVFPSVSQSVHLIVSLSIHFSAFLPVHLILFCLSLCPSDSLSVCQSVSVHPSVYSSVCPSLCLFGSPCYLICLSIHPSFFCLPVHLSDSESTYLSVFLPLSTPPLIISHLSGRLCFVHPFLRLLLSCLPFCLFKSCKSIVRPSVCVSVCLSVFPDVD